MSFMAQPGPDACPARQPAPPNPPPGPSSPPRICWRPAGHGAGQPDDHPDRQHAHDRVPGRLTVTWPPYDGDTDAVRGLADRLRENRTVTVPLEALCVLIESAQRFGVYGGTPQFDAYHAMPPEVFERLLEREKVATERMLALAAERTRDGS